MKKKSSVYFLILLLFLSFGTPGFAGSKTDLSDGVKRFAAGDYTTAYELLLSAFDDFPENPELNFYLGRAAFEIGNYEMAVMAFERILIAYPDEQRVKLEIARAFHLLGANDVARKYCYEVLESGPPDPVKKNIEAFLAFIKRSEKHHFFSGSLAVGVDWNNNVWSSPSSRSIKTVIGNVNLTGSSSKKTQDWVVSKTVQLAHRYQFPRTSHAWKTSGIFYQGLYADTSDLDTIYYSGQTGPEFIYGNNKYAVQAIISQTQLDRDKYLQSTGVQGTWDHIFNPGFIISTTIDLKANDYPGDPTKDSEERSILIEAGFNAFDTWFNIGSKVKEDLANDDENSYYQFTGFAKAGWQLPYDFTGSVSYEFQNSRYDKAPVLFDRDRMDHIHLACCSLIKKLWQSEKDPAQQLLISLSYQHTWAFSNIELYDYTKDLVQFSFSYTF